MFKTYFNLGFEHILDINGYDHVLFIISICLLASLNHWKKLLVLVTAFTIGHSLTLALSVLDIVTIPAHIIETIIPITIILSCIDNIYQSIKVNQIGEEKQYSPKYLLILFFGFIHGMGFSNFFKAILGSEEEIVYPLLAFNVGVEIAQLAIVAVTILSLYLLKSIGIKQRYVNIAVSLLIILVSLYLLFK